MVSEGFHPEDRDPLLDQDCRHLMLKTSKVGVHNVERHLDRIEMKPMVRSDLQHPEVHDWIFVHSESDMADLASFPGFENRFLSASVGEDSIRIVQPDDFMMLQRSI